MLEKGVWKRTYHAVTCSLNSAEAGPDSIRYHQAALPQPAYFNNKINQNNIYNDNNNITIYIYKSLLTWPFGLFAFVLHQMEETTCAALGHSGALCRFTGQAACFVPTTQHMVITLDSNHSQTACNPPTLRWLAHPRQSTVGELQSESLELKLRVPRTHHINHTNHINHINRIESYPSHILSTHPNLDHWLAVVLSPWFWATGHHLACECCCCRTIRLPGYLECLTYCVEVLSSQPGPAAWVSTIKSYRRGEHCITSCAVVKLTMHSEICRCQICVSLQ